MSSHIYVFSEKQERYHKIWHWLQIKTHFLFLKIEYSFHIWTQSWVSLRCGRQSQHWFKQYFIQDNLLLHDIMCMVYIGSVTCWERADLMALFYVMFSCVFKFVTFPCGVLVQVWYLIVLIPDLCLLPYFY